jgi:hypothetical protein
VARAFGNATEVTATVDSVEIEKPASKRDSLEWIVSVHWPDPGSTSETNRTGTAQLSGDPLLRAGDRVQAFVLEDSDEVSLVNEHDGPLGLWIVMGLFVLLLFTAVFMLDRARRWKRLTSIPGERAPSRV